MFRLAGSLSFWWGVGGVALLLLFALCRLAPHAIASLSYEWEWWQVSVVIAWCVFMVVSEGYDGFQRRIIPRIYLRARSLREEGKVWQRVLAPLYCLNYLSSTKKRMFVAYVALALIILAVVVVHSLSQPLRGMIDWGVIAGLGYGLIALIWQAPGQWRSGRNLAD